MVTSQGRKMLDEHNYSLLSATTCANGASSPQTQKLDDIICQFLKEQHVPGATLAVARNGGLVYLQGYGMAGAGRRMTSDTCLRVASISKPITAIAVLRLCQEGQLSLDDKVFGAKGLLRHLKPQGDKRLSKVTVRHLLQHSAGWDRDMAGDAVFWKVTPPSGVKVTSPQYNVHLLQYVLNRKLQFTPGSRHAYSNLGYLALGQVIEAVTGQGYEQYVRSLLLQLGIRGMKVGSEMRVHWQSEEGEYFNIKEPATTASVMPGQDDSSVLPQYGSFLMRNTGAFGGWVGTATDVLKIICSLEGRTLIKAADSQVMSVAAAATDPSSQHRPPSPTTAPPPSLLNPDTVQCMLDKPRYQSGRDWYGLGLDVQDGGATWGHTGAMEGTCGTVQRHKSGMAWAFLLNAWAADADLDGVVKLALSSVDQFSPFPRGVAVTRGDTLCVTTRDKRQRIMLHVAHRHIEQEIERESAQGYGVTWIGVHRACNEAENGPSFNVIFCQDASQGQRKKVVLDVEITRLHSLLAEYCERGFEPDFVTTYAVSGGRIVALSVLSHVDVRRILEVDVVVPAERYVQLLACRRRAGHRVLTQCVSQCESGLLVTAVMGKDSACDAVTAVMGKDSASDAVIAVMGKDSASDAVTAVMGKDSASDAVTAVMGKDSASDAVSAEEATVCVSCASKGNIKTGSAHIPQDQTDSSKQTDIEVSKQTEVEVSKQVDAEVSKQTEVEVSKQVDTEVCKQTEVEVSKQVDAEVIKQIDIEDSEYTDDELTQQTENVYSERTQNEGSIQKENCGCEQVEIKVSKRIDSDGSKHIDSDGSKHIDNDGSKHIDSDGSKHIDNDGSKHIDSDGSKHIDSDGSKHIDNDGSKRRENDGSKRAENEISKETDDESLDFKPNEGSHCNSHRWSKRKRKMSSLLVSADFSSPMAVFNTKGSKHLFLSSIRNSSADQRPRSLPEGGLALQQMCAALQPVSTTPAGLSSAPTRPERQRKRKHPLPAKRTLSWLQMPVDSFVAELGRQARYHSGLRDVHFYSADGDWFVSGVWSPQVTSGCYQQMAVSPLGLLPALAEAAAGDVQLRFVCPYREEGLLCYALFWEAPHKADLKISQS